MSLASSAAVLREVVAAFELPANFTLEVDIVNDDQMPIIVMFARWPDIYHPGRFSHTSWRHQFNHYPMELELFAGDQRDRLVDIIYRGARELWLHEFAEFCKFDGKHIVDPHPTGFDSFGVG